MSKTLVLPRAAIRANTTISPPPPPGPPSRPANEQSSNEKESEDTNSILKDITILAVAFSGAFGATLTLLSYGRGGPTTRELRPERYTTLNLLQVQRATSPGTLSSIGDGQHVYLSIQPPSTIGYPRLRPDQSNTRTMREREEAEGKEEEMKILSIYLKEPSLQIERPYTPLYADSLEATSGSFSRKSGSPIELLVKRYPDGELGRYAHRLALGDGVECRGPEVTWSDRNVDEVIMIVGGTGITPAYQLITSLFDRPDSSSLARQVSTSTTTKSRPKVTLLYAAQRPSSLLLVPELAHLVRSNPSKLDVHLFVDGRDDTNGPTTWTSYLWPWSKRTTGKLEEGLEYKVGRITQTDIKRVWEDEKCSSTAALGTSKRRVLVCGPDRMVAAIAGPRALDGRSQGPLGGILQNLGLEKEQVWKL